jgi:hypothetical protein
METNITNLLLGQNRTVFIQTVCLFCIGLRKVHDESGVLTIIPLIDRIQNFKFYLHYIINLPVHLRGFVSFPVLYRMNKK